MLSIDMLPAGHGDCLMVEYGLGAAKHRLLIDAGTVHSWPGVRERLVARKDQRYDVFVVTHVDEDHIGGAIALLDDDSLRHRVQHIWFNGYVHCARGGSVLGPVQGEQLTQRIAEGDYLWNEPFVPRRTPGVGGPAVVPSSGALPTIDLPGGAQVVLLSPNGPKLKKMAKVWAKVAADNGLVPGEGTDLGRQSPKPHAKPVAELPSTIDQATLNDLAATKQNDGSEANGSSIAFLLCVDGKRVLLGADAHADVLAANLARYGEMVGEPRPRIDAFKLAHHGSGANLSTAVVEAIDCRHYLVSSNGDNFGHPDDTAIARAIRSSPGPVRFSCNYNSTRTGPWIQRAQSVGATFDVPKPGTSGMRITL